MVQIISVHISIYLYITVVSILSIIVDELLVIRLGRLIRG